MLSKALQLIMFITFYGTGMYMEMKVLLHVLSLFATMTINFNIFLQLVVVLHNFFHAGRDYDIPLNLNSKDMARHYLFLTFC